MGASSVSNVSESMKICIFDLQRGHHEGEELDKILFFFPAELSFSTQLSVIGLSEGLITFTRIFSPEAACEVIEAERHTHVFYEAEPDVWMVMVVEKSKDYEIIGQIDALRQVLKEVHSLFYMFYGSIRLLLEKEPGGGLVRSRLYSFVMDYLNDFLVGKKLQLPSFRDCLKERGTVQMLTVGREAAIEVQSLVRIVESCVGSTHCHHLVMFQDLLVSSTLSPVDTVNIFSYAVSRLSPRVLSSGSSSWSYLLRGNSSSHAPFASSLPSTGSVSAQFHGSRETSPDGSENHHIGQLLSHGNWFRGKDGFLASHAWGSEAGEFAPTVWLHQTEEKMHLCVHQHKNFTFVILIPVTSILNEEQGISVMKQQILEKALLKILKVEEKLSKGWGGENAYHVRGYRYLLVDRDSIASRASPPGKVAKLTKESLIELSRLRDEVDVEKRRAGCEKDLEMCIRARNNAWIIARIVRGKELYMVLDKANETLLFASDAVEKFSDRYCDGTFSLD